MTRRTLGFAVGVTALALALLPTLPAAAAVQQGLGFSTSPAQPYLGNPNATDWLGSYIVGGEQVWGVEFAMLEPDAAEPYNAATTLTTKWGTALAPDTARDLAYLLWRYGETTSADEAAALAHLVHAWTSAPQNPGQLDPTNNFRDIAYDAPFHLTKLPAGAQQAVTDLTAEAAAHRGPWTTSIVAPTGATIGTASDWQVRVLSAAATGVPSVPVTVTIADGTLTGGVTTLTLTTPADGSALVIPVVPTGPAPTLTLDVVAPLDAAAGRPAVGVDVMVSLRRVDNIQTLTASVAGAAVAPAAAPTLPATGGAPSALVGLVAVAAVAAGIALRVRRGTAQRG